MSIRRTLEITVIAGFVALAAGCGKSDKETTDSAAPDTVAAPPAPSNLNLANHMGGLHVTWTDNSGGTADTIIERKSGTEAFAVIKTVAFGQTEYHDGSPVAGTPYTYRLAATKDGVKSAYTPEKMATP